MIKSNVFVILQTVLIALLLFTGMLSHAQSSQPNVIYVYADDLGYGELGCYGQQKIKTPFIDKLASEGIRFTQHYSGAPVCAPSRCMLLTGKHAGHSYIRGNYELGGFEDEAEGGQMPLPDNTFTIARLMKQAGYTTGAIGKWGLGMASTTGNPNNQGFDYFYGYLDQKQAHNYYPTHLWENGQWDTLNNPFIYVHHPLPAANNNIEDFKRYKGNDYAIKKMGDKAVQFIDKNKDHAFFLYLAFTIPHVSLQVPDEELAAYKGSFDEQPYHGENGYAPCFFPLSTYAAMISYLDKQVGRVMQALQKFNLDENTIVMFSSDNGATFDVGGVNTAFFNSTGGLRGRKMDLYEGGIRQPFVARWPAKIPSGKTSDLISSQIDVMATLSQLTGVEALPNDGISFLQTLLGRESEQQHHPYLYFEYPEKNGQVAIRMGEWKGVRTDVKKDSGAPWQIFNLKNDIAESENVAAQHPMLAEKFDAIQKKEHQQSHLREWEFIDPKFKTRKE
ncbi:arylsulfatase [soil metagenome]